MTPEDEMAKFRCDELLLKVSELCDGESFHVMLNLAIAILDISISELEKGGADRSALADYIRECLIERNTSNRLRPS